MKRKIYLLGALCLLSLFSLQAQEVKDLFRQLPDSLCPLLTKVNREDFIDFKESKMKAQVKNRLEGQSEMTELASDYLSVQLTPQSTWEMKLFTVNDSVRVVGILNTVCASACDSRIHFYSTDWRELPVDNYVQLPQMDDFFTVPTDSVALYEYRQARSTTDLFLMRISFSKDQPAVICTLTTPDFLNREERDKWQPFLKKELTRKLSFGK